MTRLAVQGDERFGVPGSRVDLRAALHERHPGGLTVASAGHDLAFIAGSDSLLQFATWHDPTTILDLALLAVAPRPGDDPAAVEGAAARWGAGRVVVLSSVAIGVSSSAIRERIRAGRPVRYLVPGPVERFIADHGLYRL